jgi:hypothetical protein
MRKAAKARAWRVEASRAAHEGISAWDVGKPRGVRAFGARGGGTLVVNHGPAFAAALAAA